MVNARAGLTKNFLLIVRISFFCLTLALSALGFNSTPVDSFVNSAAASYRAHYQRCTGDSSPVSMKTILAWRNDLSQWVSSSDYEAAKASFEQANPQSTPILSNCSLLVWKIEYDKVAYKKRAIFEQDSLIKEAQKAESLAIVLDLSKNPYSPYDYFSIPFGIERTTVQFLLKKLNILSTNTTDSTIDATIINPLSPVFRVIFKFRLDGKLYAYTLRGTDGSLDSLDEELRPKISELIQIMSSQIGNPTKRNYVGMFDIKDNVVQPMAWWSDSLHSAKAGIFKNVFRYTPLILVEHTILKPKIVLRK